jgi:hypothetical protein
MSASDDEREGRSRIVKVGIEFSPLGSTASDTGEWTAAE